MPAWRDIEKTHNQLESDRAREEGLWRELARMLEEDGGDLDIRQDKTRARMDSYDSTPLYAKDDFVGGLFTEAMNPADRFFSFGLEDKELAKWGPVAAWLWNFADLVAGTLDPAVSNFYLEATPWLSDMATFCSGFIAQEEDVGKGKIVDRALPIRECFKAVDADGETNRFHRKYTLSGMQAQRKWRDRAPRMRDDESAIFVQAIYENPDYRPGALGPKGMPWLSCHASPDKPDFVVERGYFEMPVHEIQWKRRSSRAWGTGPGHKALADMNMLDEMQRSLIVGLQFAVEPMLLVQNEDIMTAADIAPNALLYGGVSGQGKELVKPVDRGQNLQWPSAAVEAVRNAIREGFSFSLSQVKSRPQMTLGEFMGWKEENLRMLAPHLVCIHRGLAGFVSRRAQILQRAGRVPPPPPELANQTIRVGFKSPFAQAQLAGKARNAIQLGQAAIQLQPLDPNVGDNLDMDNVIRAVHAGLSGEPDLVRDPRLVAQLRQQRAEAQAPDIELARGAQQAAIVADVAHAQQAQTSAATRGKR